MENTVLQAPVKFEILGNFEKVFFFQTRGKKIS